MYSITETVNFHNFTLYNNLILVCSSIRCYSPNKERYQNNAIIFHLSHSLSAQILLFFPFAFSALCCDPAPGITKDFAPSISVWLADSLPNRVLSAKAAQLSDAAFSLTRDAVVYDPAYFTIPYPNGDVPEGKGVCTDVIIRTYRKLGIDLQKAVHEDMQQHFGLYPKKWGLKKTDTNIDHRRVPNLMTFFSRKGTVKSITKKGDDYVPGDIVAWRLEGGLTHIGVVVNQKSKDRNRYLVVHNIGNGQELSDCLFSYTVIGHYFY